MCGNASDVVNLTWLIGVCVLKFLENAMKGTFKYIEWKLVLLCILYQEKPGRSTHSWNLVKTIIKCLHAEHSCILHMLNLSM